MGADMTLHCAPACDLSPKRIKRMKQVVRAIPDDDVDLRELMDLMGYDDPAEAKRCVLKHGVESQYEDRQIAMLSLPGCPYQVRVAGGLSWGDPSSEAYTILEHVERCPQLWKILEEFAREDAKAISTGSGSIAAQDSVPRNIMVVLTSDKFDNEHFHYASIAEALDAIQRLVFAAEQQADGIERLIGIVVNPDQLYGDPKHVPSDGA